MAKLLVNNTGYLREIFEHDWKGEVIYPENSKNTLFLVSNELSVDSGSICFQFSLKVPKEKFSTPIEAKNACLSWCNSYFPSHFSKLGYWNFFSVKQLDITNIAVQEVINEHSQIEFDIFISEKMSEAVNNAIKHIKSVEIAFENAQERLAQLAFKSTAFGFNQSLGEARIHFQVIENILRCSADLGGYVPSDIRSALNDYEELARRKVENNHNYQVSLHNLQKIVFGISFPKCWGQKPNV